jgi:hypothetical protein
MAETEIKRVITIESTSLNQLNARIKELKGSMGDLDITTEEYRESSEEVVRLETIKRNAIRGVTAAVDGSYNAYSRELSILQKHRKTLNENTQEYREMTKRVAELQDKLKQMDAEVGTFSRNVGNYSSAFDGLQGSLAQVTRELPVLTMGADRFFQAISNNLPILYDSIRAYRNLSAEQRGGVGIMGALTKALFSWNTVITVGITLLTAYGDDIIKWVQKLFSAEKQIDHAKEAIQAFNKEIEKNGLGIGDDIVKVKKLQRAWGELGDNLDAKKRFIEDNKRALDELGIAINNVKDAEFFFIGQTDDYIAALRDRAKAEAAMKAAGKYYEKAALAQAEADSRGAKGEALSETYTNETSLFGQWVLGKDKYEVITKPTERGKLATEAQEYNNQGDALFRLAQSYEEAASAKYKFQTTGTGGGSSSSKSFTPGAFKPSADPTMERGAFDWSYAGAVDAGAEMEKLKATMAARAQMANASAEERKAIEERLSQELATIEELRLMNHEIILESMLQEDWLSFDERTEIELELTRVKEEQTALRLEAEEERAAKEKQILDQEAKEDEKRKKDRMKAASALASATSNILNSMADMAEEDSKKQKALRAAAIVMDTFQASMAGWTSAQSLMPPANFIVGAANVAASVAMGIAQLKGLQNTAHDGSNASGALSSAQSAPSVASSMPASYTRNLQGDNELTEMNKDTRVYVVESDITDAQNSAKARVESASF